MISKFCPVCNNSVSGFLPLPDYYRQQTELYGYKYFGMGETINISQYSCPVCGASDRERLCALWMRSASGKSLIKSGFRMLHFAPEKALSEFVKSNLTVEYRSCDLSGVAVDDQIDMVDMAYQDSSFDFFICSHVLEHVSDDRTALRELYRVTSPDALGILLAPIMPFFTETIEENVELPSEERWRLFGQGDHRRLYAKHDFVDRIQSAGFFVQQLDISFFGKELFDACGISETSTLYVVSKHQINNVVNKSDSQRIEDAFVGEVEAEKDDLVSITIPAFKAKFIEFALQSVLEQDFDNIEIIISDDSEGDEIEEVVKRYVCNDRKMPVFYRKNIKNLGGVLNMQQCLDMASGKYIKFLNDDDVLSPSCISRMVSVYKSDSNISLVTSRRDLIDDAGSVIDKRIFNIDPFGRDVRVSGRDIISFLFHCPINFIGEPTTVLFKTEDLRKILPTPNCLGGVSIRAVNDLAMYVNVLSHGDLVYLTDTLSYFRIHPGQRQAQSDMPALAKQGVEDFRRAIDMLGLRCHDFDGSVSCTPWPLNGARFRVNLMDSLNNGLALAMRAGGQIRAIAFHLPQFHAIPENEAWWGKGFTEWDNVRQGKPLFDGHYQPHVPGELGYYDLSDVSMLDQQARLARQYGIEGFCFYYYWFDGKRLLEKPVDQLLQHPEIDLPFCLCWANENWTRRWDGGEQEILMQQSYAPENHQRFAHDMLPYLRDSRYIRVNGKPLILIYRADIIPDLKNTVSAWRTTWQAEGVGEVYLVCVESFTTRIPQADGFDAACEFFPHQIDFSQLYPDDRPLNLSDSRANIADYSKLAAAQENRPNPGYKCFRGVVPSWDNASRRRKGGATLFMNSSPERYETWLEKAVSHTLVEYDGDERLVFINAWNEWGEGCHLEPDARYGRAYLEATQRALIAGEKVDVEFHRNVLPYQEWLAKRQIRSADGEWAKVRLTNEATFSLTVVVDATSSTVEQLGATLQSLALQQYEHLQVIVVSSLTPPDNVGGMLSWLQLTEFPDFLLRELAQTWPQQWLCLVRGGDLVCESALLLLALRLQDHPEAGLVYADEDVIDSQYGPFHPQFKPDFDLDYLRSYPYVGRFLFVRGQEYLAVNGLDFTKGSACFYDYVLRFNDQYGASAIYHFPEVVFHGIALPQESDIYARHAAVLWAHLQRRGIQADLQPGLYPGSFRVQYQHPGKPKVSIIVPTRDKIELLSRCVESLLGKTAYPDFEILIVDNQSSDPGALQFLQGLQDMGLPNVRVLSYPHPFNFSAMNNLAAQAARGEYLVLLNNDTAIVKSDWLDALLNHAQRPEVGVVGAKLLYPDGKVQHAGVVLGLRGPADHPFIGEAMDSPGYAGRLLLDQQYSAVTAACMMVRKSVYEQVGGLDADAFKVSYNDVDFCLKVKKAGFGIVWTPYSVVMHEGSVSQKQVDQATQQIKLQRFEAEQLGMYRKWMPELVRDPAYSPNLSLSSSGFELETNSFINPAIITDIPRILVHPADHFGSGSYRVIWPLQALQEAGVVSGLCADLFFDPIHIAKTAPDVIVCQRQTTDEQLRHIRHYQDFSGARLIYEVDDYLPNVPVASAHKAAVPKDVLRRMRCAADSCDRVVVSTAALKNALHALHAQIVVAPNYLPVWLWGGLPQRLRPDLARKPRIGWVGGVSHGGDLKLIADVVRAFAGRVEWVFMGMLPDGVDPSMVELHSGIPIDKYPAYMATLNLDLALAPLEKNLFNECKSNLRLLEYGACGFPVIATDIEPYRCGLPVTLVKNRFKDWVVAIEAKLHDRDALWQEGQQLQQRVLQDWMLRGENLQRWQAAWIK